MTNRATNSLLSWRRFSIGYLLVGPVIVASACSSGSSDGGPSDGGSPQDGTSDVIAVPPVKDDAAVVPNDGSPVDAVDACTESDADAGTNVCALSAVRRPLTCSAGTALVEDCAKGCTSGGCNTACDAPTAVIDQSDADDFTTIAPWQSFKVASTGILTALEARPNVYLADGGTNAATLSVYVGEGTAGARIYTESFTLPSVSGAPWRTFTLATPVPLQMGELYTWELTGVRGIYYSQDNPIEGKAGGSATLDMTFRLHLGACHP